MNPATLVPLVARFRVAMESGHWPPGLVRDIERVLSDTDPWPERTAHRDHYLRIAAGHLSGTPYQRALALSSVIARWNGTCRAGPVRAALFEAAQSGIPLPGPRQLVRILSTA